MKKTIAIFLSLLFLLCLLPITAMAAEETETGIPAELVGIWEGEGTPKNGGTPIQLNIRIKPDGTGEYSFDQGSYHESFPFTLSREDNRFSVDIPATSYLGKVDGTWELKDGILLLDITSTFTGGGSYSYTAECRKIKVAEGIEPEYKWLKYTLKVDSVEIVPGTEVDRSPFSTVQDKTFVKVRFLATDEQIATTDLDVNGELPQFHMTDRSGNELPLYSVSYWGVGFDMEKGTFYSADTQEGFFLHFTADGVSETDDLILTVNAQ